MSFLSVGWVLSTQAGTHGFVKSANLNVTWVKPCLNVDAGRFCPLTLYVDTGVGRNGN